MERITVLSEKEIQYGSKKLYLDEKHLYVDRNLRDKTQLKSPWFFTDLAVLLDSGKLKNGCRNEPMTIYLAPDVYWLAPAGDTQTFLGAQGDALPYEKKIKCEWLFFVGLSDHAEDVVIASDKGQSHGCIGNYTMFHFEGNGLHMKNLTLGNYCNLDLLYPADSRKNREKRTSVITQAQLGDVQGDCFCAENCRFISRLNLYPICGAKRSLYYKCHFESTDDSLNGNAVYLECDFDFYGGRPMSHTIFTGSVFLNCLFRVKGYRPSEEADQYFLKDQGTVYLIQCEFEDDRDGKGKINNREKQDGAELNIEWTRYPEASMKCYQYENQFQGKPVIPGTEGKDTVSLNGKKILQAFLCPFPAGKYYNIRNLLGGKDDWNPLPQYGTAETNALSAERIPVLLILNEKRVILKNEQDGILLKAEAFFFSGERKAEQFVFFQAERKESSFLEIRRSGNNCCYVSGRNNGDRDTRLILNAYTQEGLEAAVEVIVKPSETEAPTFLEFPVVQYENGSFVLKYTLAGKNLQDCSDIRWYLRKDGFDQLVSVSREETANLNYVPTDDDIGSMPVVRMIPKTSCSRLGERVEVCYGRKIVWEQVRKHCNISTDFSTFPTVIQPKVQSGSWISDFYEPADKEDLKEWRKWVKELPESPWKYGELGNGCKGKGLYPSVQGVKLIYSFCQNCDDMRLKLIVDPAKTSGQGFGSAGQYLDICIKFDVFSMSGWGLRITRTTEASDAVAMFLIAYQNGLVGKISKTVYTSCFITGCNIQVESKGGYLTAQAFSESQIDDYKKWKKKVYLRTEIISNENSGFGFFNTVTNGDGGWQNTIMFHHLSVDISPKE